MSDYLLDNLTESARLTLPHVNGRTWFDTLEDVPKRRDGKSRPFRQTFEPLIRAGLVRRERLPQREDGTRPFELFHLTGAGWKALRALQDSNHEKG